MLLCGLGIQCILMAVIMLYTRALGIRRLLIARVSTPVAMGTKCAPVCTYMGTAWAKEHICRCFLSLCAASLTRYSAGLSDRRSLWCCWIASATRAFATRLSKHHPGLIIYYTIFWANLSMGLRTAPSRNSFMHYNRKILLSGLKSNFKAGFSLRLTQEEFQYAPLCVLSAPLTTLIRHENRAFRKRFTDRRNLQTPIFHYCTCDHHVIFLIHVARFFQSWFQVLRKLTL